MKFKANITCEGMLALEKRFLPTLEKFGKSCMIMVSPTTLCLIQDVTQADGIQTIAQLDNSYIFDCTTLACQSLTDNYIAFNVSIPLIMKVLNAARNHCADSISVKLSSRPVAEPSENGSHMSVPRAMLIFSFLGRSHENYMENLGVEQEMLIGGLLSPNTIHQLRQECEVAAFCPFYLNVYTEINYLTCVVDRLKPLSHTITLTLTKQGDLHLTTEGQGIILGEGIPRLEVLPRNVAEHATGLEEIHLEDRLREAVANGDAESALMQLSHLSKALHSLQFTRPDRVLFGISDTFVHVLFVFKPSSPEDTNNDDLSLFFKIPFMES